MQPAVGVRAADDTPRSAGYGRHTLPPCALRRAVECRFREGVNLENHTITTEVERRLTDMLLHEPALASGPFLGYSRDAILSRALDSVRVCGPSSYIEFFHYQFCHHTPSSAAAEEPGSEDGEEDYFRTTALPSPALEEIWDSLHFESDVQTDVLDYSTAMLMAAEHGVSLQVFDLHKYSPLAEAPLMRSG